MATAQECLINEKIMGGCNHPDYLLEEERSYGRTYEVVVCLGCGIRETLLGSIFEEKPDPLCRLRALIPRHCEDLIMIRRVLRKLELQGWRWSKQRRDGVFEYSFSDGKRRIDGAPSKVELEAICNAVVQLASSLS